MKFLEALGHLIFWGILFGCGYALRYNTERPAWMANRSHVNITLLDCNARATFYDSLNTVPILIEGKSWKQTDSLRKIFDKLKIMFPRDTVIPCRMVRGDKYSRMWVDSVLHMMDSILNSRRFPCISLEKDSLTTNANPKTWNGKP